MKTTTVFTAIGFEVPKEDLFIKQVRSFVHLPGMRDELVATQALVSAFDLNPIMGWELNALDERERVALMNTYYNKPDDRWLQKVVMFYPRINYYDTADIPEKVLVGIPLYRANLVSRETLCLADHDATQFPLRTKYIKEQILLQLRQCPETSHLNSCNVRHHTVVFNK
jgi:hypothetical protein